MANGADQAALGLGAVEDAIRTWAVSLGKQLILELEQHLIQAAFEARHALLAALGAAGLEKSSV